MQSLSQVDSAIVDTVLAFKSNTISMNDFFPKLVRKYINFAFLPSITDICQDSTDYDSSSGGDDSFTTEGIATVDIVEYEVASASDGDADSVDNSSSGTDVIERRLSFA